MSPLILTRELRDRWLEHVNSDPLALQSHAKYALTGRAADASRQPLRQLAA